MVKRGLLDTAQRRKQRAALNIPVFEWGGVFENWSRKFVKRNFWRVSAIFQTEEDALQECASVFVHCRNKYAGKLDGPQHLMAIYKTALQRAWHTFAARDPQFRFVFMEESVDGIEGFTDNETPLSALISQVDEELQAVIEAVLAAPAEFISIIFRGTDTLLMTRRLARMFNINAGKRDLVIELRELLADGLAV